VPVTFDVQLGTTMFAEEFALGRVTDFQDFQCGKSLRDAASQEVALAS
jgi:hypothetical protein